MLEVPSESTLIRDNDGFGAYSKNTSIDRPCITDADKLPQLVDLHGDPAFDNTYDS